MYVEDVTGSGRSELTVEEATRREEGEDRPGRRARPVTIFPLDHM